MYDRHRPVRLLEGEVSHEPDNPGFLSKDVYDSTNSDPLAAGQAHGEKDGTAPGVWRAHI